jgi:3-dehydroquinate dehydratase
MLVLVRSDGHSRALMLAKDILKQTGSYEHTSYAIQDTPTTVV